MLAATNSFERALNLMDLLRRTPTGLTSAEMRRLLSIPKSSCLYITNRLRERGYIVRDDESGRYRVGLTPLALAYASLREIRCHLTAEPALYRLAYQTGLSSALGVFQRGRVLIVDRVEAPEFVHHLIYDQFAGPVSATTSDRRRRLDRDIGRELPLHSTALGKVLLAYLQAEEVMDLLGLDTLPRLTPTTITSVRALLDQLETVRQQGYATADAEQFQRTRAIAAPVFDREGQVRAAVVLNGRINDARWKDSRELIEYVKEAALDISTRSYVLL